MGEFDEILAHQAGKRLGVQWCTWMGDWFTSWSPRNSNSNAEGPWGHWVDLALRILQDPMTATVRPDAHEAVAGLGLRDFYGEVDVSLTDEQLAERFGRDGGAA